jgi:hypothetical protein
MGRAQSPVEALFKDVLAQAVTPRLKAAGFRKADTNYHRRRGATVQVVNIQISHGSSWSEKSFYVNAGIAFDAVCQLAGLPVLDRPKEYECDGRGTRDRLEGLIDCGPGDWVLRGGEPAEGIAVRLGECIDWLRAELDRIDGPAAYRAHPWFDRFRPKPENAQVLYVLGDLDGAWAEVQALAALFADRQNANQADWWIGQLHLKDLESRRTQRCT